MSDVKESSNDNQNSVHDSFVGYQPLTEYDLNALRNKHQNHVKNSLPPIQTPRLLKLKILSVVFFVSFLFLFVWQALIVTCRVTNLCELFDLSSQLDSPYLFRTFRFRILSSMIWLGLLFGSFIFFLCSLSTLRLVRMPVTSKSLHSIGYYIRQAASHILLSQYLAVVVPAFILFIVLGMTINWSTAGSFSLGAMMCILLGNISTSICAKANVRVSTGSSLTFSQSFNLASFAASILFLSTLGLVAFSVATVYLFYSDIQALAGFITGSSFTALVLRTSSALSFDAMISGFNFKPPFREVLPPNIVAVVALGVSVLGGFLADIFSTFALCIIATGILGSGLPYYSRNQFALCVFNHLGIDQICGTFGYPQELSFSSLLCRSDSMYLLYPSVEPSASASVFVAVPFILMSATIAVFTISSIVVYYNSHAAHEQNQSKQTPGFELISNSTYKISGMIALFQIISSSAIFFGLFGPWSLFQKSDGTGFGRSMPRMVLDGSSQQCVPSLSLLPQGLSLTEDRYRPLFISGTEFGSAGGIASRLFFCNFIGIIAGAIVVLLSFSPNKHKSSNNPSLGTLAAVLHNCSVSLLIHISVSVVILITLLISHQLNGPYGVGVATIGYLSSSSGSYVSKLIGIILMNGRNTEISTRNLPDSREFRDIILDLSRAGAVSSQIVSNGAVTLSAIIGIFAVIQKAEIWPSPRDLVGSVDLPPPLPISSVEEVSFTDISIVVGLMLGATVPFFVGAISTSGTVRSGLAVYVERRKQGDLSVSSSSPLVIQIVRTVFQECSFIPILSILLPLCIGFGFGHRTLISMLTGLVGVGYGIGTTLPSDPIRRRSVVPNGSGDIVKSVKESVGPSIQVSTKLFVGIALAMSTLMRSKSNTRWVGYLLLVILIVSIASIAYWRQRRFSQLIEISRSRDTPETWEAPARTVSPFYEDGSTIEPRRINPSSAMGETIRHFGQCQTPLTPQRVGLRNGTVWTTNAPEDERDMVVPRPQVPLMRSIVYDEARHARKGDE